LIILLIGPFCLALALAVAAVMPEISSLVLFLGLLLWMIIWWVTEVVPLFITALLPIVWFPILGFADAKNSAAFYVQDVTFLFMAGALFARAVEKTGLHCQLALACIRRFGGNIHRLLLGVMATTFFLSMWMTNTAATLVMLPVVSALNSALKQTMNSQKLKFVEWAFLLSLPFAASVGGITTPIGTASNMAFIQLAPELFAADPPIPFSFARWLVAFFPLGCILLLLGWTLLDWWFLRSLSTSDLPSPERVQQKLQTELSQTSVQSAQQRWVLWVFITLLGFWLTRAAMNINILGIVWQFKGWGHWFPAMSDASIGMAMALLLFVWPHWTSSNEKPIFILSASDLQQFPWGIILLLGGGVALAAGIQKSGLTDDVALLGQAFPMAEPWLLVFIGCVFMVLLTELASNVTSVQILVPILVALTSAIGFSPVWMALALVGCASLGYMLPVASPPNSIVFSTNKLPARLMMVTGFWLNLMGILIIGVLGMFWFSVVFKGYF